MSYICKCDVITDIQYGDVMDFNLIPLLTTYDSISLEEMGKVRLMNRVDTKYVVSLPLLEELLRRGAGHYRVQEVDGERMPLYRTTYMETSDYAMYKAHLCGKKCREKIRVRTYDVSGISFLEVKNKSNKGRTKKKRIQVQNRSTLGQDGGNDFLRQYAWYGLDDLSFHLENAFNRITLVDNGMRERLTIDLGLRFHNLRTGHDVGLERLAIVELKRAGKTYSKMAEIMKELRVQPCGFSKYCIGTALTSPDLKQNRFKPKLRMAEKLMKRKLLT